MAGLCHFCRAAFYPVTDLEHCSTQTAIGWARGGRGKKLDLCGRVLVGGGGISRKPNEDGSSI